MLRPYRLADANASFLLYNILIVLDGLRQCCESDWMYGEEHYVGFQIAWSAFSATKMHNKFYDQMPGFLRSNTYT